MAATAVPRTIVKLGLNWVRVPLSVAEHFARRSGTDLGGSRAVAVYDLVEAETKKAFGRLLRDGQLVAEGERQADSARQRGSGERSSRSSQRITGPVGDATSEARQPAEQAKPSDESIERREESGDRAEERLAEIRAEEERAKQEAKERARKLAESARQAEKARERAREKAAEAEEKQAELAHASDASHAGTEEPAPAPELATDIGDTPAARNPSRRSRRP